MSKKKQREKLLSEIWSKPLPLELDVADRGDHLKVTSCSPDVVGWWIGTLRAIYPQDHLSGDGQVIKMHPRDGVTLKLNKQDGTLRIKGKKHMDWFSENFASVVDAGAKEMAAVSEMAKQCDRYLKLQDSFTVRDLLTHLPASGAFKHGPSYIYRLWRGLLDKWIGAGADVYVVTPLLDAKRLADVLLMLVKHKLSGARVHLMCLNKCEPEARYGKVLKDAKELLRELKGPNRKRLVQEERLRLAEQRLDARFGRFQCKLIAMCQEGRAEAMVTSASFHKWHYELDNGDTLAHFKLSTSELVNNYLAPLGLAHQVILDSPLDDHLPPAPSDLSIPSRTHSLSPSSPNSLISASLSPSSPHSKSVPSVAHSPVSRSSPAVNHVDRSPESSASELPAQDGAEDREDRQDREDREERQDREEMQDRQDREDREDTEEREDSEDAEDRISEQGSREP